LKRRGVRATVFLPLLSSTYLLRFLKY
jgi:hypothetical protein